MSQQQKNAFFENSLWHPVGGISIDGKTSKLHAPMYHRIHESRTSIASATRLSRRLGHVALFLGTVHEPHLFTDVRYSSASSVSVGISS